MLANLEVVRIDSVSFNHLRADCHDDCLKDHFTSPLYNGVKGLSCGRGPLRKRSPMFIKRGYKSTSPTHVAHTFVVVFMALEWANIKDKISLDINVSTSPDQWMSSLFNQQPFDAGTEQ